MDRCRLRRSDVENQRISAHFAVAKRTIDFIFQFLLPDRHQINSYLGCQKGKIFYPSDKNKTWRRRKRDGKGCWEKNQKNPKSHSTHLSTFAPCEPDWRFNWLIYVEHGAKNFVKKACQCEKLAVYFFNSHRNSRQNFDLVIDFFLGFNPHS